MDFAWQDASRGGAVKDLNDLYRRRKTGTPAEYAASREKARRISKENSGGTFQVTLTGSTGETTALSAEDAMADGHLPKGNTDIFADEAMRVRSRSYVGPANGDDANAANFYSDEDLANFGMSNAATLASAQSQSQQQQQQHQQQQQQQTEAQSSQQQQHQQQTQSPALKKPAAAAAAASLSSTVNSAAASPLGSPDVSSNSSPNHANTEQKAAASANGSSAPPVLILSPKPAVAPASAAGSKEKLAGHGEASSHSESYHAAGSSLLVPGVGSASSQSATSSAGAIVPFSYAVPVEELRSRRTLSTSSSHLKTLAPKKERQQASMEQHLHQEKHFDHENQTENPSQQQRQQQQHLDVASHHTSGVALSSSSLPSSPREVSNATTKSASSSSQPSPLGSPAMSQQGGNMHHASPPPAVQLHVMPKPQLRASFSAGSNTLPTMKIAAAGAASSSLSSSTAADAPQRGHPNSNNNQSEAVASTPDRNVANKTAAAATGPEIHVLSEMRLARLGAQARSASLSSAEAPLLHVKPKPKPALLAKPILDGDATTNASAATGTAVSALSATASSSLAAAASSVSSSSSVAAPRVVLSKPAFVRSSSSAADSAAAFSRKRGEVASAWLANVAASSTSGGKDGDRHDLHQDPIARWLRAHQMQQGIKVKLAQLLKSKTSLSDKLSEPETWEVIAALGFDITPPPAPAATANGGAPPRSAKMHPLCPRLRRALVAAGPAGATAPGGKNVGNVTVLDALMSADMLFGMNELGRVEFGFLVYDITGAGRLPKSDCISGAIAVASFLYGSASLGMEDTLTMAVEACFEQFDQDGDGWLSKDDFIQAAESIPILNELFSLAIEEEEDDDEAEEQEEGGRGPC